MSNCKFCGSEVIGEDRFCPQCGKALDGSKKDMPVAQAATTPQKKKGKGKKIVIGIIGVCLVLAIAFCTVLIITRGERERNRGLDYYLGAYVEQDYEKAVEHLQKAANLGDAAAQYCLGLCYNNGQGVAQDYTKAVEYYQKAADQGYAAAQYSLGLCYECGCGVEKDLMKAAEYYRKAVDQGNSDAKEALEKLGTK